MKHVVYLLAVPLAIPLLLLGVIGAWPIIGLAVVTGLELLFLRWAGRRSSATPRPAQEPGERSGLIGHQND